MVSLLPYQTNSVHTCIKTLSSYLSEQLQLLQFLIVGFWILSIILLDKLGREREDCKPGIEHTALLLLLPSESSAITSQGSGWSPDPQPRAHLLGRKQLDLNNGTAPRC